MTHKQVWFKVNAQCDEGILPLVVALNEIDGLITGDSCQDGAWGAYVFFTYGETWEDLASLLQAVSTGLSQPGLQVGYTMSLEWCGSNETPRARIALESEHVRILAEALRALIPSLNSHRNGSCGNVMVCHSQTIRSTLLPLVS